MGIKITLYNFLIAHVAVVIPVVFPHREPYLAAVPHSAPSISPTKALATANASPTSIARARAASAEAVGDQANEKHSR